MNNASTSPLEGLKKYLPDKTYPVVAHYLKKYNVALTIKVARKTVLGDYRRPHNGKGHRISVNGDLNQYAFFLTLIHEIAHLLAYEKYGNRIKPHGVEWKIIFKQLMDEVDVSHLFPMDISHAVQNYMQNPAARSCSDAQLVRTLRRYDAPRHHDICLVEELKEGEKFKIKGGETFVLGSKLRKRYQGKHLETGTLYIFSPLYEVKRVE